MSFLGGQIENDPFGYGGEITDLIIAFFEENEALNLTVFTFTELYSFIFFDIVRTLIFDHINVDKRALVVKNIIETYYLVLKQVFDVANEKPYSEVFDKRVAEYISMGKDGEDTFDILERVDLYLNQSSATKAFFQQGDPLFTVGFAKLIGNKLALSAFYSEVIMPYIETIIKQES